MAAPDDSNYRGPIPAATWIEDMKVPDVIDKFLRHGYSREQYKAIAKRAESILKEKLKDGGVYQFKLSARAKDKQSLKEKLIIRYRDEGKDYKDDVDIKKDIVDLAGVRIILYMPTKEEYERVRDVIMKEWGEGVKPKKHPPPRKMCVNQQDLEKLLQQLKENNQNQGQNQNQNQVVFIEEKEGEENPKKRKYRPRHLGYSAIHYRVPMKDDGGYDWMENDQVELQVVSALTHAWAEVGHDILYKSYAYGPPPIEEERTLDALNGLIQSGDLLLEQFQEMLNRRTSLPFEHREQLTGFLRNFFASERELREDDDDLEQAEFPRGEGIYILFKFLELEKLNSPMKVRRPLKQLQYPFEHHVKERQIAQSFNPIPRLAPDMTVVVCLIRHLLHEKPYEAPQQQRSARDMCAIMMSALTILQYTLNSSQHAKDYLQRMNLTADQTENINFLLRDSKIYTTLEGKHDQEVVEPSLQEAWTWFRTSASDPASLCGFLFRLAEMGCRKYVDPITQLDQLHITPLSRSSTTDMADEAGASASVT